MWWLFIFFFFKQKTAYEMRISDWSSDVCSSDLFRPRAIDADFNHIPDAAMTAAVVALFADGPSVLRNIGSWRVKETDRIAAMAAALTKLGAIVVSGADYIRIEPPAPVDGKSGEEGRVCQSGWLSVGAGKY